MHLVNRFHKRLACPVHKVSNQYKQYRGISQLKQQISVKHILHSEAIQAKYRIGLPGDKYEQEADRVADQVMKLPESRMSAFDEKKSSSYGEGDPGSTVSCSNSKDVIRKKESSKESPGLAPVINNSIQLPHRGRGLSSLERGFFEPRFGVNFSNVRIHDNQQAANISRSINARAFTFGNNVVFGSGEYSPGSGNSSKLLAHELTHVVQQNKAYVPDASDKQSIVHLTQHQPVIQRVGPTDEERYVNTLTNAGTNRATWDAGYINPADFLGVNISRGIHQELDNRLTLAETYLRGEYPGETDAQIASNIGLNTISGKRPIRNAVGGSRLSNHSYGIAIDVNYSANPFIGRSDSVNNIINRISQLMTGNNFEIRTVQAGTNEEIRARFSEASQAFADYFNMRGNRVAIRQLVLTRGLVTTPEPPGEIINPWRDEEIDNRVEQIYNQIEADATNTDLLGDMEMTGIGPRPLTDGFIDLSAQLVEALSNHANLYWGARYQTGKDIMHFDWRNGTIRTHHRE